MTADQPIELSFVLRVRNAEPQIAGMVRQCIEVARRHAREYDLPEDGDWFEILILEARSSDNTASVISVLHTQISQLRSLHDLSPSRALAHGIRAARGSQLLISDRVFSRDDARWALSQLARGRRAASVPAELIVIDAELGHELLGWLEGGLASAQARINDHFRRPQLRPLIAWKKPQRWGFRRRISQALRSRLGRVGLGRLDQPRNGG